MKRRQQVKHFLLFLRKNHCYDSYFLNFKAYDENVSNFFKKQFPLFFLFMPFRWAETPEGDLYWRKLDDKWKDYCHKNLIKNGKWIEED